MLAAFCSQDKQGIPWWLGLSYKGIGQYDLQDKLKPRKVSVSCRPHSDQWASSGAGEASGAGRAQP